MPSLTPSNFSVPSIFSLPPTSTAVITGGTRGLGLHCASGLLLAGCNTIIITSRKVAACESAKKELESIVPEDRKGQVKVYAFPADLAKFSEVERFVGLVKGVVNRVDYLVANAGATWGEKFDTHPDSAIAKIFDLNVRSVFNLIRLMAPLLTPPTPSSPPSRVITLGSIAGIIPGVTNSPYSTFGYSASKAAVHHLTRNLALELGPRGILVNCIAPGFFPSKMADGLIGAEGGIEELGRQNPNGRLGRPEDIAGTLVWLCGKAGEHVNGVIVPLDGGKRLDVEGKAMKGAEKERRERVKAKAKL
ncbi:hypothetical protein BDZ91DRAFT_714932 [Kalaharituber pfeilii]|nr:hypothetical protein BDZ91DRAFT_714932 [Kalaharituber pfeilii]